VVSMYFDGILFFPINRAHNWTKKVRRKKTVEMFTKKETCQSR